MKGFVRYGMMLAIFLSLQVTAEDISAYVPGPAPAQEYHAAGMPSVAAAPVAASVSAPAPAPAPAPQAVVAAAVDSADKSVSIVTNTQKEITDLAQNTLAFEQQADQRIQDLTDSNRAMGAAIQSLMQTVSVLQQKALENASKKESKKISIVHNPEIAMIFFAMLAIIMLLSGIMLGRMWHSRARVKIMPVNSTPAPVAVTEPEYDFMNTAQAIPAKLDLARSYIAMSDIEQAKGILKTVLEKGDDLQKREARQLLENLKVL